jgi:hypothetical protein
MEEHVMKRKTGFWVALFVCLQGGGTAFAAVDADAAKSLGTTLTDFGAEKAANADGSIPAYSGGLAEPGPGYKAGSTVYPDPFASEKPILTIDAKNMAEHESNLSAGQIAMFKKYPDYRIEVYPTHRTAPYPDWVSKNSVANATKSHLVGAIEGDGVSGAYGGIPFPIPKNGYEVMWNFYLHWMSAGRVVRNESYLVEPDGGRTLLGTFTGTYCNQYYDPSSTSVPDLYYLKQLEIGNAPSSQVGYNLILSYSLDYSQSDILSCLYTPGQRRVRTAPEFTYDTPAANFDGALTYDEVGMFSGRMDRFDFKLIGKKEIYVPYNVYKPFMPSTAIPGFLTGKFPNPDMVRFEKHRVWVVEATLKSGQRHIMSRRTFYVDEDSWILNEVDEYDHAGQLYRIGVDFPCVIYDPVAPYLTDARYSFVDLTKGSYFFGGEFGTGYEKSGPKLPDTSRFTPSGLMNAGVR